MPPSSPKFKRPTRRSRLGAWWLLWRVPTLLLIVMALWWFLFRPIAQEQGWVEVTTSFAICAEPGPRAQGCVVDGDTVVVGFGGEQRRIRLTGFDTPELDGACEAERELAQVARARLHRWLNRGAFEWNGADDPPRDRYGRELRRVRRVASDGAREYLAETMIAAELASESGWGAERVDWCD